MNYFIIYWMSSRFSAKIEIILLNLDIRKSMARLAPGGFSCIWMNLKLYLIGLETFHG